MQPQHLRPCKQKAKTDSAPAQRLEQAGQAVVVDLLHQRQQLAEAKKQAEVEKMRLASY